MRRILLSALAVGMIAFAGTGAQAHSTSGRAAAPRTTALLAKVTVTVTDRKFVLSAKSAKRGVVTFKVTNVGKREHNFSIHGRKTKVLSHGKSATLRVIFLRKGAYPYKSTQTGDAAKGLAGVFTIK